MVAGSPTSPKVLTLASDVTNHAVDTQKGSFAGADIIQNDSASDLVARVDFESFEGALNSKMAFDESDEAYTACDGTVKTDEAAKTAAFPPSFLDAVRAGLDNHGLVLIDNIDLAPADFLALTGQFGRALDLPRQLVPKKLPNFPELARVGNFDEKTGEVNPRYAFGSYWHHDGDFWPARPGDSIDNSGDPFSVRHNHIINLFHSKITPARGGHTGVLSMVKAFENLQVTTGGKGGEALARAMIEVDPANIEDFRGIPKGEWLNEAVPKRAEHAVIQEVNGQKSLYLPFFAGDIEVERGVFGNVTGDAAFGKESRDVEKSEDVDTIATYGSLFALFFGEDDATTMRDAGLMHEQVWRPRQMLVWDNLKTMHKALGAIEGKRLMWRAQAVTDDNYGAAPLERECRM